MKCERCGRELSDIDLYCDRCGQAVFPEYMDEEDVWAYYKSDTELEQLLKDEKEGKTGNQEKRPLRKKRGRDKNSEKKARKLWTFNGKKKRPVSDEITDRVEEADELEAEFAPEERKLPEEEPESEEVIAEEEIKPEEITTEEEAEEESEPEEVESKEETEEEPEPEEVESKEETEEEPEPEEVESKEETEEESEPEEIESKEETEEESEPEEIESKEETEEDSEPEEIESKEETEEESEPEEIESKEETEEDSAPEEEPKEEIEPEQIASEEDEEELVPEELEEEIEAKEIAPEEEIEEDSESEELEEEEADDIDMLELEDEDFFEDDDEEEEEPPLSPERKRAKRRTVLVSSLFLALCLGIGIFLGINRMKKMEEQEKDYYDKLYENPVQTASKEKTSEASEAEKEETTEGETKEELKEETKAEEPEDVKVKEEKQETEAKQNFKLINPEKVDFSQYKKLQPASTEENSVKASESYDYSAKSVVDGDINSSWQENEEDLGEGKGVRLNLDGKHKVRYLVLYLGNWRSEELWQYNARPKVLSIQVGENQKKEVEFTNEKKKFCLSFEEPIDASFVAMYIQSAYEGERWDDNCISEIEIYE